MDTTEARQVELVVIDKRKMAIEALGVWWAEYSPFDRARPILVWGEAPSQYFGEHGRRANGRDWLRALSYVIEQVVGPYKEKAEKVGLTLHVNLLQDDHPPVTLLKPPWVPHSVVEQYGEPGDLPTKDMLEEAGRAIDRYAALKSVAEQVDNGEIRPPGDVTVGPIRVGDREYSFTLEELHVRDLSNGGRLIMWVVVKPRAKQILCRRVSGRETEWVSYAHAGEVPFLVYPTREMARRIAREINEGRMGDFEKCVARRSEKVLPL